jgi:hypothetical protein
MFTAKKIKEILVSESGVLLLFLVFSTYAFVETNSFRPRVAQFPRMMSGFVIVGSVLLLARPYLPAVLQPLVESTGRGFGSGMDDLGDGDDDNESAGGMTEREVSARDSAVTTALIGGYTILSFLIRLLWATPLFVAVYSIWFGQSRLTTAALVVLTFGIGLAFMTIFNMELASGVLT